jgi:hypothetical protein
MKPEEFKKEGLRSTRIPTEYRATYTLGSITGEGFITDISENGVAMRTKQVLVEGDRLHITSPISSNLTLEFEEEVRSIQGNIIGIMIVDIDPDLQRRFISHIEGMLRLVNREKTERFRLDNNRIKHT